ncbi:hypothetical protein BJY00DRAFT_301989 [Aspergillus carlsbadensis]|nr:hypothetical protein BJY00DRAFT_301989 [Aspergillus carlsbadensis]
MHAVTTWDHQRPDEFRGKAKSDILARYDTVEFKDLVISSVEKTAEGLFHLVDENGTFHCLFCHGYEDRHVPSCGVLCAGDPEAAPPILHLARHAARLVSKVTIYTNGREELAREVQSLLRGDEEFKFDSRIIDHLEKGAEGTSVILQFTDGSRTTEGFLVNRPKTVLHREFASQLGCKMTKQGAIEITEPFCQTSIPGAFAAGDCAVLAKTVMNAMATGGFAGAAMAAQLEAEGASLPSAKG